VEHRLKLIELSQGRVAIVDDKDFEWLSKWKWYYQYDKRCNTGYAKRNIGFWPHQKKVYMHIAIMKHHKRWGRRQEVDHIDNCGCDNRKVNLRLATRSKQTAHKGLLTNNTSGVTGVYWNKRRGAWKAEIMVNGKSKFLGYYSNKKDAIKKRQQAEIKYFGEFRHDPTNICPLGYTGECPDCAARLKKLQT